MALERKVSPVNADKNITELMLESGSAALTHNYNSTARLDTYWLSLMSVYWMATRPSILPTANPPPVVKQETTRVCNFKGLSMVLKGTVGLLMSNMLMLRSAVAATSKGPCASIE